MSVTHEVKCWPGYFDALVRRDKRFDVRRDDRGYQKGDSVIFQKFDPARSRFVTDKTGAKKIFHAKIKYILTGGQFGIEPGYVVLGF